MKHFLTVLIVLLFLVGGCIQEDAPKEQPKSSDSSKTVKVVSSSNTKDTEPTTATKEDNEEEELPPLTVACVRDADCGSEEYGDPYCWQGDISQPVVNYECINGGTINARCNRVKKEVVEQCIPDVEFCKDGECLVIAEQPCEDSDGGIDYDEYGEVIDGRLHTTKDRCGDDDKTIFEAYCGTDKLGKIKQYVCKDKCSNGRCVDE